MNRHVEGRTVPYGLEWLVAALCRKDVHQTVDTYEFRTILGNQNYEKQ